MLFKNCFEVGLYPTNANSKPVLSSLGFLKLHIRNSLDNSPCPLGSARGRGPM